MLENHKSIEELYLSSEFANEEKKQQQTLQAGI